MAVLAVSVPPARGGSLIKACGETFPLPAAWPHVKRVRKTPQASTAPTLDVLICPLAGHSVESLNQEAADGAGAALNVAKLPDNVRSRLQFWVKRTQSTRGRHGPPSHVLLMRPDAHKPLRAVLAHK